MLVLLSNRADAFLGSFNGAAIMNRAEPLGLIETNGSGVFGWEAGIVYHARSCAQARIMAHHSVLMLSNQRFSPIRQIEQKENFEQGCAILAVARTA